jgi:hypothetical protein
MVQNTTPKSPHPINGLEGESTNGAATVHRKKTATIPTHNDISLRKAERNPDAIFIDEMTIDALSNTSKGF